VSGRLAGLVLVVAAGGCTRILGIDYTYQGTGGSTATGSGGHTTTTTTATATDGGACGAFVWDPQSGCQGCVESFCCTDLLACDDGTPCASITACARACKPGDTSCLTTCINADSNMHGGSGLSAYAALEACFGAHCDTTTTCSFPVCASGYTWPSRACADCLGNDAGCCAALTACGNDPVCVACVQTPSAMGCSSNTNFQKAYACETQTCGVTCTNVICESVANIGYTSADCNYCVSKAMGGCCTEFNACVADVTCNQCIGGTSTAGCSTSTLYSTYNNCVLSKCSIQCAAF